MLMNDSGFWRLIIKRNETKSKEIQNYFPHPDEICFEIEPLHTAITDFFQIWPERAFLRIEYEQSHLLGGVRRGSKQSRKKNSV